MVVTRGLSMFFSAELDPFYYCGGSLFLRRRGWNLMVYRKEVERIDGLNNFLYSRLLLELGQQSHLQYVDSFRHQGLSRLLFNLRQCLSQRPRSNSPNFLCGIRANIVHLPCEEDFCFDCLTDDQVVVTWSQQDKSLTVTGPCLIAA